MATHYNVGLPFDAAFILHPYGQVIPIECWWDSLAEVEVDRLPTLKENVPVSIRFAKEDADAPEQGELSLESSLYDDNGEAETIRVPLMLPTQSSPLYRHEGDKEYPWRMGYYLMKATVGSRVLYSGIQVIPNHLDKEQVKVLHGFLEKHVQDLCYDLVLSQDGYADELELDTPHTWYQDYMRFLVEHKPLIAQLLARITKNPHEVIETQFMVASMPGKESVQGERWTQSSKGLSRNQGIQPHAFFLNKRKKVELNNSINRWMKRVLQLWKRTLDDISIHLRRDLDRCLAEEQQFLLTKSGLERSLQEVRGARDVHPPYRRRLESSIRQTEDKSRRNRQIIGRLEYWRQVLNGVQDQFSMALHHSFLFSLEAEQRRPMLKAREQLMFEQLYEDSNRIRRKEGDSRRYKPVLKPTWKIYEYFVFLETVYAVHESRFAYKEGLEGKRSYQERGFSEGSKVVLESEEAVVHVWYDKQIPMYQEEAERLGEHFYTNLEHNRPDVKLDYYRKEEAELRFVGCLVLDAKDSRLRSLYNSNYVNRVRGQLSAYQSIMYCGPHTGGNWLVSRRPCVDLVCCVHSGEGGDSRVRSRQGSHDFIHMYPSLQDERIYIVGEAELKDDIEKWLASCQSK